ncbi:MAG: EAL domain-containing protein [Acidimicrobiales bacterium]|jgi:diguanylate cyclase (GGDEF)-like protein
MGIASNLQLAIAQENGLVVSTEAFIIQNPDMTNTEFLSWVKSMQVTEREPEVRELGFDAAVRPDQLSQFVARFLADPPQPVPPDFTFQVTPPPENRPYYCLTQFSWLNGGQLPPLGYDVCASQTAKSEEAQDLDGNSYVPYTIGKTSFLVVIAPVYPGEATPPTAQARVASLLGVVGLETNPTFILDQALRGHPGTAIAIHFHAGASSATYRGGTPPVGAASHTTDLHNGWRIQTYAAVRGSGITANGNALALLLGGILLSGLLAALIYLLGTGRSRAMTLVRERTQELHHQALHDALTGLPNRALILDRIDQMLARSRRDRSPVAVLFLDLDNFKDVNDTLGHAAGDELLVGVGARLSSAIREQDTVGRLGGDEFVVVAQGDSLDAGAEVVAARILDALATPFEIAGSSSPLSVSASIGIAENGLATSGELLRDADIALYQAKAAGKQRAVVFAPSMQNVVDDRRDLDMDLRRALESDQFFLLYQPVVDLASGAFTGVEALLRWRHPTRGVVQPDEFIPELEASGLIVPIGRWVLNEACRQGAIWQGRGHQFTVSINVSAKQVELDQFVDDVREALDTTGFDPARCILELTESTLMHDVEGTVARLTFLKTLGVRLAVDDFGTGYSSLAYLRQFPIDVLKIDRSFVAAVAETEEAAALVHSMVLLGSALHLETVAEGVENNAQRRHLAAENVDTAQGFLFARPLEVADVDELLADTSNIGLPRSSASR